MSHERAIVVSRQWASVFTALLVALVVGGVSYAWTANAQMEVLKQDVYDLKVAKLDVRLARMEEKIDWLVVAQRKSK